MKLRSLALCGVSALLAGALACSSANPAAPVAPASSSAAAAADGSTLKSGTPGPLSPTNDLKLTTATVALSVSGVGLQFAAANPPTIMYRFQVFNPAGTMVDDALVSGTSYTVAKTLADNTRHTWRARAEVQTGQFGPWSQTASFVTLDPAVIDDPLTNGKTVGAQVGGRFVAGQGWQSLSLTDGINYDLPTPCSDCRIVFDATNFGPQEGLPFLKDLKWLSMATPAEFTSFDTFRDGPWKMHLVQRADFPTGMEIVWRNGRNNEAAGADPGDHRIKANSTPITFSSSQVYHFQLDWGPSGYDIQVNGIDVLSMGWGRPYAPTPMRIQIGCIPRAESIVGAIYRNFRLTKH